MIEFFEEQVENVEYCENCGFDLRRKRAGKNIAHILPKRIFKSVAAEPRNILYLCSTFDREDGATGCHEQFDSSWDKAQKMPVWKLALQRFGEFRDQVKETSKILFYFDE